MSESEFDVRIGKGKVFLIHSGFTVPEKIDFGPVFFCLVGSTGIDVNNAGKRSFLTRIGIIGGKGHGLIEEQRFTRELAVAGGLIFVVDERGNYSTDGGSDAYPVVSNPDIVVALHFIGIGTRKRTAADGCSDLQ